MLLKKLAFGIIRWSNPACYGHNLKRIRQITLVETSFEECCSVCKTAVVENDVQGPIVIKEPSIDLVRVLLESLFHSCEG